MGESVIVGEPKSCIAQKTNICTMDFCILIGKIVLDMKTLYSNMASIAFRGNNALCMRHRSS